MDYLIEIEHAKAVTEQEMNENKSNAASADQKQDAIWAKIGDGRWYAIPPTMAESFRKAGAEVRHAHELPK